MLGMLVFCFCLALVKISCVIAALASVTRGLTALTKAVLAVCLAVSATSVSLGRLPVVEPPAQAVRAILLQAVGGLLSGLVAQFAMEAVRVAGQIAGSQLGLSLPSMLDPVSHEESSTVTNLLELLATLAFLRTDALARIVTSWLSPTDVLSTLDVNVITRTLVSSVGLGLYLIAPLVVLTLMIDVTVALIARVCPQIPVLSVSLSCKCICGAFAFGQGLRFWSRPLSAAFRSIAWR